MAGIQDVLFGSQGQYGSQPLMTDEQRNVLNQLLGGVGGNFQQAFGAIGQQISGQNPAMENELIRKYQQQFIPQLSEQFGGAGALGSSGFSQMASQGAQDLMSTLGAQRAQIQQQGLQNLQSLIGQGLGTQANFPTYQQPGKGALDYLSQIIGMFAPTPKTV